MTIRLTKQHAILYLKVSVEVFWVEIFHVKLVFFVDSGSRPESRRVDPTRRDRPKNG